MTGSHHVGGRLGQSCPEPMAMGSRAGRAFSRSLAVSACTSAWLVGCLMVLYKKTVFGLRPIPASERHVPLLEPQALPAMNPPFSPPQTPGP